MSGEADSEGFVTPRKRKRKSKTPPAVPAGASASDRAGMGRLEVRFRTLTGNSQPSSPPQGQRWTTRKFRGHPNATTVLFKGTSVKMSTVPFRKILGDIEGVVKRDKLLQTNYTRKGDCAVTTADRESAQLLLQLTKVGGVDVSSRILTDLLTGRLEGVSTSIPVATLREELRDQGVTAVTRCYDRSVKPVRPKATVIVTFTYTCSRVPEFLQIGIKRFKVLKMTSSAPPTRCYKCLHYYHTASECRSQRACFNCGEFDHEAVLCCNPTKCKLCGGPHDVRSLDCPKRPKATKPVQHPSYKAVLVGAGTTPKPTVTTTAKSAVKQDACTQTAEEVPEESVVLKKDASSQAGKLTMRTKDVQSLEGALVIIATSLRAQSRISGPGNLPVAWRTLHILSRMYKIDLISPASTIEEMKSNYEESVLFSTDEEDIEEETDTSD